MSDSEKRKAYDLQEDDSVKRGNTGGGNGDAGFNFQGSDPFNVFHQFFGSNANAGGMNFNFNFGAGSHNPRKAFPRDASNTYRDGNERSGGRSSATNDIYSEEKYVVKLSNQKFPTTSSRFIWLVEFYAPW